MILDSKFVLKTLYCYCRFGFSQKNDCGLHFLLNQEILSCNKNEVFHLKKLNTSTFKELFSAKIHDPTSQAVEW